MPTSPPKPCNAPGCPALTRSRYCEAHAPRARDAAKAYDQRRASDPVLRNNAKIRSSSRWQKLRRAIIAQHPLCADPFGDHARRKNTAASAQVHHIKPLGTHPELSFDPANLMPLCWMCHSRIENQT